MSHTERERLVVIRFGMRTLLIAFAIASVTLALSPLIETDAGFIVGSMSFMGLLLLVILLALWFVIRNNPRSLGRLLVCNSCTAMFLILGPIASYHINGRAWYDYGLTNWDPPPYQLDNGIIGISDYDPKFTRPAIWPVIGPIMLAMCYLSVLLLYVPPTALLVSLCVFVSAVRLRHVLTSRQILCVWILWVFGLLPVVYMYYWGSKVFEWIAD